MEFTDMMGMGIQLDNYPKRIVSLVPSQTELLYELGLEEEVVGITKFCIHPDKWFRTKTRIGGPKKLNIAAIQSLNPDLIIANKEENIEEEILLLQKTIPVWISDINTLDDALKMILELGNVTGKTQKAKEIYNKTKTDFTKLPIQGIKGKSCAYLIWYQPLMVVGAHTFINDILTKIGLINVFKDKERYPETSWEELSTLKPDIILLSSEPYPFSKKHQLEFENNLPNTIVTLVDGEPFTWYGSRLMHSVEYFEELFD
ncbi:MAG TPA: helical backbone metal receptor [Edaphocola sp.]|nr:helical backbone metal receptor [Edaphocola sp.]